MHVSVRVVSCEFADGVLHAQVPQLHCVISTTCQEGIKGIVVAKGAFIELHCMGVSLMSITGSADHLVLISIIYDELLIRASNNANC